MVNFGFIVGTGRCGTTLLAKMLNAHQGICVPHELQILMEEDGNGGRLLEVFQTGSNAVFTAEDYIRLIEERCPYRIHEYFDLEGFFKARTYPEKDLSQLVSDLFSEIARSKSKSWFIEQTPWYGQHIPTISRLFPDAKFIHVIRDGRDVAISFSRTRWWSKNVLSNLNRWEHEVSVILRDSSLHLKKDQVHTVRYEDLVLNTENTLRGICAFLGIEFNASMLDSRCYFRYELLLKDNVDKISSSEFKKWDSNSKQPTFSGSIEAWKKEKTIDFSNSDSKINDLLFQFGYEKIQFSSNKKTSLKSPFKILFDKILKFSRKKDSIKESSPLKDGHHAVTEPFFDTLLKLDYIPRHIVDVGANRGNWTRTALKYFPHARFTMIEPQEKMRQEVTDLLALPGIEFHCMGAGPVNMTMHLSQHERDDSHTFALTSQQAKDFGYPQIEVPVVALDDFFEGRGLPRADILKIDAEGWDLEVLKGARRTAEAADIVLMEAAILNPLFTNTAEDVIGAMSRLGFSLFDITDLNRTVKHGALWLVEFAFVKRDGPLKKAVMSYA